MAIAPPAEPTVYIGSHIKAFVGGGTNGDPNPSSLTPGQQVKRAPNGQKLVDAMKATVPATNAQTRTISAAPLAAAHGLRSRQHSGETVPSVTDRGGGQRAALTNAMNRGRK